LKNNKPKLQMDYLVEMQGGDVRMRTIQNLSHLSACRYKISEIRKIFDEIETMDLTENQKAKLRGKRIFIEQNDNDSTLPPPTDFTKTINQFLRIPCTS
jgi:division protein CdvB (Snf7/Vps24/ESCRT-III family)